MEEIRWCGWRDKVVLIIVAKKVVLRIDVSILKYNADFKSNIDYLLKFYVSQRSSWKIVQ